MTLGIRLYEDDGTGLLLVRHHAIAVVSVNGFLNVDFVRVSICERNLIFRAVQRVSGRDVQLLYIPCETDRKIDREGCFAVYVRNSNRYERILVQHFCSRVIGDVLLGMQTVLRAFDRDRRVGVLHLFQRDSDGLARVRDVVIDLHRAAGIGADLKLRICRDGVLAVRFRFHELVIAVWEILNRQRSVRFGGQIIADDASGCINRGAIRFCDVLRGNDLKLDPGQADVLILERDRAIVVEDDAGELLAVLVERGLAELGKGDPLVFIVNVRMVADAAIAAVVHFHIGDKGTSMQLPSVERVAERSLLRS